MSESPGLTVLIPCYNEGEQVDVAYRAVCEAFESVPALELLFVDDGSTDDTLSRLEWLAEQDPRVRYLSFARNFGLAAAVTAGFRYASQPWTVQLDADLQIQPGETWALLDEAARGYDIVFGIRRHRRDSWLRRAGAAGTFFLARRLLGIEVPAGASSFRVVRTAVGRTVVNLPAVNSHIIAKAPQIGARYTTVPVDHAGRQSGRSRFRLMRLGGDAFDLLFGFSWRPLNATYLVSAVAFAFAFVLALLGILGVAGPTAVAIGGVLVSAVSVAAVSIVGRYLHRRLVDAQPRRLYYVRTANVAVSEEDMLDGGTPPVAPPVRRPRLEAAS
jgi:glycosyltransferase involved in cell wall biosynthesis